MMIDDLAQPDTAKSARGTRRTLNTRLPLLSAERERHLAVRIKAGDPEAREELILANLPLVRSIASAFRGRDRVVDLNDLIQEGNLGLLRAASDFDPEAHGTRFVNYAACWIRYSIRRVLAEQTTTIRYPYYLVLLRRRFEKAREQLIMAGTASTSSDGSSDMDFEIVAERTGLEGRRLKLLQGARGELHPRPIASINEPSCDAALTRMSPPHEPLEIAESMERLYSAMRGLTLIEAWLLRRRYRLDDSLARPTAAGRGGSRRGEEDPGKPASRSKGWRTFRELSAEIGMPIHQLRSIERAALSKLQNILDPGASDGSDQSRPSDRAPVASRKSA
jgi:RNA polymerase primary sigma factor